MEAYSEACLVLQLWVYLRRQGRLRQTRNVIVFVV